ncbi:hypothetical protein BDP27DRAFT_1368569 [Rhodocollybia butyracea]|uniref:Uncharacterized protein n=1 Tax=Rhodocollybia butyracea TaxID=206335 RepID=A0A9P5U1D9_9AGAR|nr:hypothetical protein BDP27DRAFT_1368569 [Rhodocollybia butyracea]
MAFDNTLGAIMLGQTFSAILCGITLVQVIQFFKASAKDSLGLKILGNRVFSVYHGTPCLPLEFRESNSFNRAPIICYANCICAGKMAQAAYYSMEVRETIDHSSDCGYRLVFRGCMFHKFCNGPWPDFNLYHSYFGDYSRYTHHRKPHLLSAMQTDQFQTLIFLVHFSIWPDNFVYYGIYMILPKVYFNSLLASCIKALLYLMGHIQFTMFTVNSRASSARRLGNVVSTVDDIRLHSSSYTRDDGTSQNTHKPTMIISIDHQVETMDEQGKQIDATNRDIESVNPVASTRPLVVIEQFNWEEAMNMSEMSS